MFGSIKWFGPWNLWTRSLCYTQIWLLESTLLYHIGDKTSFSKKKKEKKKKKDIGHKGKIAQMDKANLFKKITIIWFVRKTKIWKPSSRSYKRAIRYASIVISDWRLGKQLRTISQNRGWKRVTYPSWLEGFYKNPSKFTSFSL